MAQPEFVLIFFAFSFSSKYIFIRLVDNTCQSDSIYLSFCDEYTTTITNLFPVQVFIESCVVIAGKDPNLGSLIAGTSIMYTWSISHLWHS